MSILSDNLQLLRIEASLSLEELSEKTGINQVLLENFETGKTEPNEYQVEVLCHILKMPAEDIYTRNLVVERQMATKQMKSKINRENFNWYFGNRKRFAFYLGYVAYFLLGIALLLWIYIKKFENVNGEILKLLWTQQSSLSYPAFVIQFFYYQTRLGLSIFGLGVSIFLLFDYFSCHTFYFRWWYLLWFSTILLLLQVIGLFGSIPYLVYVVIRLIKGKY